MSIEMSSNDGAKMAKFFEDFGKAQSEINNVLADSQGHNYKYAELHQVLAVIREPFFKYGLAIMQFPSSQKNDDGTTQTSLTTLISHKSGEWIKSSMNIDYQSNAKMSAIQALGSHITYARRYMASAICGVSQVDNLDEINPSESTPTAKKEMSEKSYLEHVINRFNSSKTIEELTSAMGELWKGIAKDLQPQAKQAYDAKKAELGG